MPRIIDEESLKRVNLNARLIAEDFADCGDPLLSSKERSLLHIYENGDNNPVEKFRPTFNDIDMAVREGIEGTWIDRKPRCLARHRVTRVAGEGSGES